MLCMWLELNKPQIFNNYSIVIQLKIMIKYYEKLHIKKVKKKPHK